MVRLFKTFIRPLFITANRNHLTPWEIQQTKYLRKILDIPYLSNINTRKLANLPTISKRISHLAYNYYHKNKTDNIPINNFINNQIRKKSQMRTPYSIINKTYKKP